MYDLAAPPGRACGRLNTWNSSLIPEKNDNERILSLWGKKWLWRTKTNKPKTDFVSDQRGAKVHQHKTQGHSKMNFFDDADSYFIQED